MTNKPDALEMLRAQNLVYPNLDHIIAALEAERAESAERDAKISSFLEEAAEDNRFLGELPGQGARRARTNIREALALLGGGTK